MKPIRIAQKTLYFWIREFHLYLGLFVSPFILVFAISAILFNHAFKPWDKKSVETTTVSSIQIPDDIKGGFEGWPAAKQILGQLNVSGEIGPVRYRPNEGDLTIPVFRPGLRTIVTVDLENQTAQIERTRLDVWQRLLYLHRTPGPHRVSHPPNWIITHAWGWLADTVVYLVLFVSASGVYMWTVIKAERKVGLLLLGAGALSFFLTVFFMLH